MGVARLADLRAKWSTNLKYLAFEDINWRIQKDGRTGRHKSTAKN
jgi:hypothetical protein